MKLTDTVSLTFASKLDMMVLRIADIAPAIKRVSSPLSSSSRTVANDSSFSSAGLIFLGFECFNLHVSSDGAVSAPEGSQDVDGMKASGRITLGVEWLIRRKLEVANNDVCKQSQPSSE